MNDDSNFNRWLQQELTRDSIYLADNGFTDGVMAALPAQRPRSVVGAAIWTILFALITGVLGLALLPGWDWVYSLSGAFVGLPLMTLVQLGLGVTLALGVVATVTLRREA